MRGFAKRIMDINIEKMKVLLVKFFFTLTKPVEKILAAIPIGKISYI